MFQLPCILADVPRGDPSPIAWLITIAYFVAAGFSIWAGRCEKSQAIGRARQWLAPVFWFVLGGLLIFLGFNKQLDLQTDFTNFWRRLAREEGWYDKRRPMQALFIAIFSLVSVGLIAGAVWYMRDLWRRYRLAFVGIVFLCTFVLIRAASIHHVDKLLYHTSWSKFWVNNGLELGGNGIIIYAAWKATRPPPRPRYEAWEKDVSIR